MTQTHVAFLGLGTMGGGMARRLLGAGFALNLYNRTAAKAEEMALEGRARVAETPREAARNARIIIGMVADDAASREMWLGEKGALAGTAPGAVLVESSTLSVPWIRELAEAARAAGCELLDAPVSGSRAQAAAGALKFFVGGSAEALEHARPVLEAMGQSVVHLGPNGSGAMLKLINNFLCGVQAASLAEAMAMVERSGLDRAAALEVLTDGAAGSPILRTLTARMTARDYMPSNFILRLMAKDLDYAAAESIRLGIDSATAAAAHGVFRNAIAAGDGERDLSAVAEQFRIN